MKTALVRWVGAIPTYSEQQKKRKVYKMTLSLSSLVTLEKIGLNHISHTSRKIGQMFRTIITHFFCFSKHTT